MGIVAASQQFCRPG